MSAIADAIDRNVEHRKGVAQTSRGAYYEHVLNGGARTQRERIMALWDFMQIPLNRRQISELTHIPINAVCGRVGALLEADALVVSHTDLDPETNKRVEYLEPAPQELQQGRLGLGG